MKDKYDEVYQLLLDAWGEESQIDMCIEEMSELTKEFIKLRRLKRNKNVKQHELDKQKLYIQEEIADVLNTVEQMRFIFGKKEVDSIRDAKIERVKKKL